MHGAMFGPEVIAEDSTMFSTPIRTASLSQSQWGYMVPIIDLPDVEIHEVRYPFQ